MAMSLGLLWGSCGVLSFGQAGFFALGGYAIGLVMGREGLPVNPAYLGILCAALACAALAAAIGYFLFSAGVRDSYFVLVTLALSIMVEQIAVSQSEITGGWNGMFINRMSLTFPGFELQLTEDAPIYYLVLAVAALVYLGLRLLQRARFGKILVGIRENEPRMEALGYAAPLYKTAAFALSGGIAGLAGALYATHAGFVAPSLGGVLFSTEVVVWVAVAGRESLLGRLPRRRAGVLALQLPERRRTLALAALHGPPVHRRDHRSCAAAWRASSAASRTAGARCGERAARGRGAGQALPGPRRQRRHRLLARARRDPLGHRPERRRQDHLHQHDLGPPRAHHRPHPLQGAGHHAPAGRAPRPARHRPQVPDAQPVRQPLGPRERRARRPARRAPRAGASARCWTGCAWVRRAARRPSTSRTASGSGSRSRCCSPTRPSSCCWTSRRPA